jgi:hypothetical protein
MVDLLRHETIDLSVNHRSASFTITAALLHICELSDNGNLR